MTLFDDVKTLRAELIAMRALLEECHQALDRHEQEINGRNGLAQSLDAIAVEIRSLRRAAYWIAGIIVAASITFAFSVLSLVG